MKDNPLEAAFARAWAKECKRSPLDEVFFDRPLDPQTYFGSKWKGMTTVVTDRSTLAWNLGDGLKPGTYTVREAEVVATVIQWLGSHIGQQFLMKVLTTPAAKDLRKQLANHRKR